MTFARVDANQSEKKRRSALENLKLANAATASRVYGVWRCGTCKKEARATVHQMRKTYCSMTCMAEGYKERLKGANNPNFKALGQCTCEYCGNGYVSYKPGTRFCSTECHDDSRRRRRPMKQLVMRLPAPEKVKQARVAIKVQCNCLQCGGTFLRYPSSSKKYCTYECHIKSGGSFRAGIASVKARMKYGPKKDANHNEIMTVLRKYCAVHDLSTAGCGIPDGIAYVGGGWQLFDIKNPKTGYGRRGLNPVQKRWIEQTQGKGGPVYLIYTTEEAEQFAKGEFAGLKREGPVHVVESVEQAIQIITKGE